MRHWLCMNFRKGVDGEMVSRFIDGLDKPWEWAEVPASVDRLLVIRCESVEEMAELLRNVPDRNLMTAFGFSQEEVYSWNSTGLQ